MNLFLIQHHRCRALNSLTLPFPIRSSLHIPEPGRWCNSGSASVFYENQLSYRHWGGKAYSSSWDLFHCFSKPHCQRPDAFPRCPSTDRDISSGSHHSYAHLLRKARILWSQWREAVERLKYNVSNRCGVQFHSWATIGAVLRQIAGRRKKPFCIFRQVCSSMHNSACWRIYLAAGKGTNSSTSSQYHCKLFHLMWGSSNCLKLIWCLSRVPSSSTEFKSNTAYAHYKVS